MSFDLEQREAAMLSGYTWCQYERLPGTDRWLTPDIPDSKASVIAFYRMHNRIESVRNDMPPQPSKGKKI